jgi:hypothetical protein
MIGWVVGGVVLIALILFFRRAAFIPGCGAGVPSPDGRYEAMLGTRRQKTQGAMPQTYYEISVSEKLPIGDESFCSFELFRTQISASGGAHDLRSRRIAEIIKWGPDSAAVTFYVSQQPIVVNVKELASDPETRARIDLVLQEAKKRSA